MENKIDSIFKNFGLSPQETKIYVSLLQLEKPSVAEISRKSGLPRVNIYFYLDNLKEKGLVKETAEGKIKRFVPTKPKEVAEKFQRWTTDMFSIVPELESARTVDDETPVISVRNFALAHYEHYNELASLPEGGEFRVIQSKKSADLDFQSFKKDELQTLMKRMVERKIMTRAIFTDDFLKTAHEQMNTETYKVFKQRLWQIRSVNPESFDFEEMMIHNDKVTFLLTDIGIMVQIQHKRIARAMTSMFDALWLTGRIEKFK